MTLLSRKERAHLPVWDDPADMMLRRVDIDLERCDGCKLCTVICPSNVLELTGEKGARQARIKDGFQACISCNNCLAICTRQAIQARQSYDFAGYYKQLGMGEFSLPRKF